MKVRVKTNVDLGEGSDGQPRIFQAGQTVDLDEGTAKASPWAFEPLPTAAAENGK